MYVFIELNITDDKIIVTILVCGVVHERLNKKLSSQI